MLGSGLLDEFFPALGAGDGNLALASGDADGLLTLGAGKVAVVPILDAVNQQEKLAVLIVAFVGAAGEAAHQRHDQKHIAEQIQDHIHQRILHEDAQNTQNHAQDQNRHIQTVMTVAARHKTLDSVCDVRTGLTQPAAKIVHWDHLFKRVYAYYMARRSKCNRFHGKFTEDSDSRHRNS